VDETQPNLKQMLAELMPRLRRFGLALTGSMADAEDLVQAACERALQRSAQLRVESRLDAWMYSIMHNLWIDERRAQQIRRHEMIEAAAQVVGDEGDAIVEARSTLAAVRRALGELPEEQRTVLILVCVDGLSYKQAAGVLDIPIGTVMSRLARGRQALHDQLDGRDNRVSKIIPMERRR
jgi:RNA polymerase sigma-70 factor (ECF subfamily)